MKNIRHHSIIITAHEQDLIRQIKAIITELVKVGVEASNGTKLIGDIAESLINNFYTLIVYPDGSKEGHETSDDWDIVRKKIIDHLVLHNKSHADNPVSYIEVSFGSDDGKAAIVNHG